jgi:ABC-type enterochelin transport system permease subunit
MILKVANTIVHDLRHQPLLLALVVINVLFLVGTMLIWREVGQSVERKDALLVQLADRCFNIREQKP